LRSTVWPSRLHMARWRSNEGIGMKGFVVDTSVLYYGKDLPADFEIIISPGVVRELEKEDMSERLQLLMATRIRVHSPSKRSMDRVLEAATKTGDSRRVSMTDREILALAIDLGYELLTDDYSIQNLAAVLGVPCRGFDQRGIRRIFEWESKCKGCGRQLPAGVDTCDVCGSETRTVRKKRG